VSVGIEIKSPLFVVESLQKLPSVTQYSGQLFETGGYLTSVDAFLMIIPTIVNTRIRIIVAMLNTII
jgi:hypothetical protein